VARISDVEIERQLFHSGATLEHYVLVDGEMRLWSEYNGAPQLCRFLNSDALGDACVAYLRARGVREYERPEDVPMPDVGL